MTSNASVRPDPATAVTAGTAGWRARFRPTRPTPLAAGAAALAGIGLAWVGGPVGVLGAAAAAAALWWGVGAAATSASGDGPPHGALENQAAGGTGGQRRGTDLMVRQVVPVWHRQMLATRARADKGLAHLRETFAGLSGAVDKLADELVSTSVAAGSGAVGAAVQAEGASLSALLAPSRRAFAERDAAVAEVGRCADGLSELQQLVKQAREIARHTRLVAFNAAIEAQRSGNPASAGGSHAVASEVRMLASRMSDNAEQIDRLATGLHKGLAVTRRQGEINDTSPEELRLEIELRAREALDTLHAALSDSLRGSSAVRQASRQLHAQVDDALLQFQFIDHLSQTMALLGKDMHDLVRWVAVNPHATQSDAADWLAALEASYTTDEQRSQHHGNPHIDTRGPASPG